MKPIILFAECGTGQYDYELARAVKQEGLMIGGGVYKQSIKVDRSVVKVLAQDSGGFQMTSKKKIAGQNVFANEKAWMDRKLEGYEYNNVDFGIILDHPLVGEGAEPFSKALRATIRNTKYMEEHRSGHYKLYHVLKGIELYPRYKSNIKLKEWKNTLIKEIGEGDGYAVSYPVLAKLKRNNYTALLDYLPYIYEAISDLDKKPLHMFAATGRLDYLALSILSKKWKNIITLDSSSVFQMVGRRKWLVKESENIYTMKDWNGEHCSCPICKFDERLYGWHLIYDEAKNRYMVPVPMQRHLSYHNINLHQEMLYKIWKAVLDENWEVIAEITKKDLAYIEAKAKLILDKLDSM